MSDDDGKSVVVGFSGLSLARPFKRHAWPHLEEREYNICQGADAAAAIVVGGELIAAAAEERFNGHKHSSAFPLNAIEFCLKQANVKLAEIDFVAHSFSFDAEKEFYRDQSPHYLGWYEQVASREVNQALAEEALGMPLANRFVSVPHHVAHAESAFAPSGFDRAMVLVSDGLGERSSATVFTASRAGLQHVCALPALSSIGVMYGIFTMYLGFEFLDGEYKVMGLAPYGNPSRFKDVFMSRWVRLIEEGRYTVPLLLENIEELDKETYRAALDDIESVLGPRRSPGEKIEQRHMDVAAALQASLEMVQLHLLRHFRVTTGERDLCLAGGVALNCAANGAVHRAGVFDRIFVQPASGDDGAAVGAALSASRSLNHDLKVVRGSALGPEFTPEHCSKAAKKIAKERVTEFLDMAPLVREVARLLADGAIVGWFQGRMEFGPRALGNRSILADPRRPDMRERINALVKKREAFRPFAPAVIAENASEIFCIATNEVCMFENMLLVARVRPEFSSTLPATTHVDDTARVQTVEFSVSPLFHQLLCEFGLLTGIPVLLNTSFNVAGQPIVTTPEQAIDTFIEAKLDALVMGRTLVVRGSKEEAPR